MAQAVLTISSKNYSSWSLRGWLLTKMSGIDFEEKIVPIDDPAVRAELLLLSSSILVPSLSHNGITVWDSLAIGEYLNEIVPQAYLLPQDQAMRARCRSISSEMHSGFSHLRGALPMNIRGHFPKFKVFSGAQADIERITTIWKDCFRSYDGDFLFGNTPCMADAMYAPVATRFKTYDVRLDPQCADYCERILSLPFMQEWIAAAKQEPEDIDEFEIEF